MELTRISESGARGEEPTCQGRRHKSLRFNPWVEKIPCRRKWQPTPVCLPGESHGQRSLLGYSPRGHKRVGHNLATKHKDTLTVNGPYGLVGKESAHNVGHLGSIPG